MKKILLLFIPVILIFAGCSKHMVLYSGEIQPRDTIFIVPVPGYSYNVTVEKPEAENVTGTRSTVISTSSGKLVNVPENGDVSEVLFEPKSPDSTSVPDDVIITEGTDQDTVHIYYKQTGEWEFVDCNAGDMVTIFCGDNVIRIPCIEGTVVECNE